MKPILQVDATDCGPACLAMVLARWGRREPLYRLRDLAATSQNGTTLLGLKQAAETLNMEATPYEADLSGLREVQLPAVLHWKHNHYVVLERLNGKHAHLLDPAQGKRRVRLSELEAKWTGKLLGLRPGLRFERGQFLGKRGLAGLLAHLTHFRGAQVVLAEIVLATAVLSLFSLVSPLLSQVLFDRVLTYRETQLLPWLLGAIFGLSALQAAFGALRAYVSNHLAMSLNYRLQMGFLDHLLHLPLRIHETRLVGDFLQRFGDLTRIREVLTGMLVGVPTAILTLIASVSVLFFYNVQLALVAASALLLDVAYLLIIAPRLRANSRKLLKQSGELSSLLIGQLEGVAAIKSYQAESWAVRKGRHQVSGVMDQSWQSFTIQNGSAVVFGLLGSLSSLLTLWYGAGQVLELKLSVGQLVATYGLVGNAVGAVSSLIASVQAMQQGSVSSDRLAEVLELPTEHAESAAGAVAELPPLSLFGALEGRNLSFAYQPHRPLLQDASFRLERGSYTVLLGRNGSGKTTLCNVLTSLLAPSSGELLWDGLRLSDQAPAAVRARVAYQRQEVPIFYTSVQDNLCLGRDVAPEQLAAMLRDLGLDEVVRRLPEGLGTTLGGDSPHRLSSGERQLLGLGRLLLSGAEVLILDEPTSTLDMDREARVVELLRGLKGLRTLLVITHRPALIEPADQVLELSEGRIRPAAPEVYQRPYRLPDRTPAVPGSASPS